MKKIFLSLSLLLSLNCIGMRNDLNDISNHMKSIFEENLRSNESFIKQSREDLNRGLAIQNVNAVLRWIPDQPVDTIALDKWLREAGASDIQRLIKVQEAIAYNLSLQH